MFHKELAIILLNYAQDLYDHKGMKSYLYFYYGILLSFCIIVSCIRRSYTS